MTCPNRYSLFITDSFGEGHGLILDWGKGGAGLKAGPSADITKGTLVSTKGDYGVRDVNDYWRIIQTDWSEGCGQPTYDRDADSESAFLSSKNIDTSTIGEFKLGPATICDDVATTMPVVCAGLKDAGGSPLIWRGDSASPYLQYSNDCLAWAAPATPTYVNGAAPTCLTTDGVYVYGCFNGVVSKSTIAETTTFSADGSNQHLTHCAFSAGSLYATNSNTHQIGVFLSGVWTALSPTAGGAINLEASATFALVASGNYVYWGVSNGMVTKVYKALYAGGTSADVLTCVATFPTGFVGASMYAYLGTVYVGGHFDGESANTGIGSIYAIVGDTAARLTDVGADKTRDNRVLSISAYERNLYFISDSNVWRWDLVNGGYSHWYGPLDSVAVDSLEEVIWNQDYTFSAAPDGAVESTAGDAHVSYGADGVTMMTNMKTATAKADVYVPEDTIDAALGTTVELLLPADYFTNLNPDETDSAYFGVDDGAYNATITLIKRGATTLCTLGSSGVLNRLFTIGDQLAHSVRLTLYGKTATAYLDGVEVASTTVSDIGTADKRILYGFASGEHSKRLISIVFTELRWVNGIYGEQAFRAVSGAEIACWRDKVVACCSGYGSVHTSSTQYKTTAAPTGTLNNEVPPFIRFSRSSGNMPTVEKYFHSVHATTANSVPEASLIIVTGHVDGIPIFINPDHDVSSDTTLVFPIGEVGKNIDCQFNLVNYDNYDGAADATPVITEAAILFKPMPRSPKQFTYFVRCWENVESESPEEKWDENAQVVADWLEDLCSTVVTVERPGRSLYKARVDSVEYLEAPPSRKANGREGLYQISLEQV